MVTPLNEIAAPAVLLRKDETAEIVSPSSLPTSYEEVSCRYLSDDILIDARKHIYKLACDEEKDILTSILLDGEALPIDITSNFTAAQVDKIIQDINWKNQLDHDLFDRALKEPKS